MIIITEKHIFKWFYVLFNLQNSMIILTKNLKIYIFDYTFAYKIFAYAKINTRKINLTHLGVLLKFLCVYLSKYNIYIYIIFFILYTFFNDILHFFIFHTKNYFITIWLLLHMIFFFSLFYMNIYYIYSSFFL